MKTLKDEDGKDVQRSAAEIMAEIILEGMEGKLIISQGEKSITYANPLHAVKLYQDYMLKAKEMWLRAAELKKKEKGSGGGIRVVLPSVPVDPLLRPGQPPRGLRLLGQDPSKPINYGAGREGPGAPTAPGGGAQRGTGPSRDLREPAHSEPPLPAPAFDPAELIEDFEHPICQLCLGVGWVRDENGIQMVRCEACEGRGRAPQRDELLSVVETSFDGAEPLGSMRLDD
jgi:hypothetical protein